MTAEGNDNEYMERLLMMIDGQHAKTYTNLVIVDMSRPGPEQFNLTKYRSFLNIPVHYLHLSEWNVSSLCLNNKTLNMATFF